jgi:hypothetical protein
LDEAKRDALLSRRRLLQLRQERQVQARQFRELAPLLRAQGLGFSKRLPASLEPWLATTRRLPGLDERVDWQQVPGAARVAWSDAGECTSRLRDALGRCAASTSGDRVVMVFHPAEAALVIGARDLIAAWPVIHDRLYDTVWIVPFDRRPWLIEISPQDRELCFAVAIA